MGAPQTSRFASSLKATAAGPTVKGAARDASDCLQRLVMTVSFARRVLRLIDQLRDGLNQLTKISGLGDIALRACAQASLPVFFMGCRRIKKYGSDGIELANVATHLDSGSVRELAAQQVQVKALAAGQAQAVPDGLSGLDLVVRLP